MIEFVASREYSSWYLDRIRGNGVCVSRGCSWVKIVWHSTQLHALTLWGISDDEHLVSNVSKDGMASHTTYLHLSLHDDCTYLYMMTAARWHTRLAKLLHGQRKLSKDSTTSYIFSHTHAVQGISGVEQSWYGITEVWYHRDVDTTAVPLNM